MKKTVTRASRVGLAIFLAAGLIPVTAAGPRVASGRAPLSFPSDHGAHPDAALEWWYYTGHLRDGAGREYGFQLTFFRVGEIHLAHFAWSDAGRARFEYEEKTHLALPGIASAETGRLGLVNEDWSASESLGRHRLQVAGRGWELSLELSPAKPPVFHGQGGVSRKGAGPSDYSHYVSITRFSVTGRMVREGRPQALTGSAWFDHEWGPGGLPEGLRGWDWFAVQLDDGSELMLYRLRGNDGRATPFSAGTFIPARGAPRPLRWEEIRLAETKTWRSPRSRALYPAAWEIAVPALALEVRLEPLLPDQELVTERSTGVTYWEGACRVTGTVRGRSVAGRAYAELTGYAGRDVPGFPSPPARTERGP